MPAYIRNFIKILTIFIILHETQGWRSFIIELQSFDYETNPEAMKEFDIKIITHNGHKVLNGTIVLAIDLVDFTVDVALLVPRLNMPNWELLNITANGCEYFEGRLPNKFNLLYIILHQLQQTNPVFPKKCPIEKNKNVYITNYYINADQFPSYMPDMNFNFVMIIREKNMLVLKVNIHGALQSKAVHRRNRLNKEK